MKELNNAGLVFGRKEGAKIVYCLDVKRIKEMERILGGFLKEIVLLVQFSVIFPWPQAERLELFSPRL